MRLFALALLAALAACGANPAASPCAAASFREIQARTFSGCGSGQSSCHLSAPFGASMDLTADSAYRSLLHYPSTSSPEKFRVEPGDLEHSFLWLKLTNSLASGEGVPMPRDADDRWAPLPADELEAVRCWIVAGAANN